MHGQLLIGLAISLLNIGVHATVMTAVTWSAHRTAFLTQASRPRLRVASIMMAAVTVLMAAHYVEIAIWALFYRLLDVAPKDGDAFYFAFVNYTTLGYGDIVPVEQWRVLGPHHGDERRSPVRLVDRRDLRRVAQRRARDPVGHRASRRRILNLQRWRRAPRRSPRNLSAADIDKLHPAIFRRLRIGAVEQILLAETDRLDAGWVDPERIDQRLANGVRALLAELEIGFAVAYRIRVPDDQEAIALQIGMVERIRDQSDGPVGLRADARRIEVEINGDRELRQLAELSGQRHTVDRVGAGRVAHAVLRLLAQIRGIDARSSLEPLETVDDVGRAQAGLRGRGNAASGDAMTRATAKMRNFMTDSFCCAELAAISPNLPVSRIRHG